MNNNDHHLLESGYVEQYVLGTLPAAEIQSMESAIASSPLLANEVRKIQRSLERYAHEHAVAPRAALRTAILSAALSADGVPASLPTQEKPTVPSTSSASVQTSWYKRYAAIASVAFLLSGAAAVYFGYSATTLRQQVEQTQYTINTLQSENSTVQAQYKELHDFTAFLHDERVQSLHLEPSQPSKAGSSAVIAWNSHTGDAYLHTPRLPAPPPSSHYQVWAVSGTNTYSLGILDAIPSAPLRLKAVTAAQEFMISAEPHGGSATPTAGQVFLYAKVYDPKNMESTTPRSRPKRKHRDSDEPVPGY